MKSAEKFLGISGLSSRWLNYLTLAGLIVVFAWQLRLVERYAVNIPYWDDWAMFERNHPSSLDLPWLYEQANDHRTTTTKILVWALYRIDGWNVRRNLILNFLIYGSWVALLTSFATRMVKDSRWTILAFGVFLFSPIIWLNHAMAYMVAVHFWLLFFFLTAYFLFHKSQHWIYILLGCLSSVLSIYSFAAGIATSLVTMSVYAAFKAYRLRVVLPRGELRRRELWQLLITVAVVCGTVATWFGGWQRTPARLSWVWPYREKFWIFFFNLVAFGFGVDRISLLAGVICSLVILAPVAFYVWSKRADLAAADWLLIALVLSLIADLALISIGRAEYGLWSAKFPYYAEHGMPLIVLSAVSWSLALKDQPKLKALVVGALWVGFAITFANNWSTRNYETVYAEKLEGRRCVQMYYQKGSFDHGGADARCPTIFPWPGSMEGNLETAKRLRASFYRELTEQ